MRLRSLVRVMAVCCAALFSMAAQAEFTLSSPLIQDGGMLPADLKCSRNGGDGLSPPLSWAGVPAGTNSFAIIMHHYPKGTVEGVDNPSHYWLVWNIPADVTSLSRGNVESVGNEGSNKDRRGVGYTPPCSPGNEIHTYIITVYALSSAAIALGDKDDMKVDWAVMTKAIEGKILASSSLTFKN